MEAAEVHKLDIDNPIIAHLERCQGWLTEALPARKEVPS